MDGLLGSKSPKRVQCGEPILGAQQCYFPNSALSVDGAAHAPMIIAH
jgi:hypothetical protein